MGWAQAALLLFEDPVLVDAATLKEAVMRHARAKQINRDDERGQKQKLSHCEPGRISPCIG